LLMAVRSLLDPSGTVGRDEAEALDKVLDDLQLREVGDDRIEFSFNWLIPADGTVARFGPITGTIQRRGRVLTPAERSQLEGGGRDRRDRRVLVHQLEKAGLSYDIARAVSVSPFAQLGEALLGGDPEWPGVPDGFDHHEFNEFLREKYRALPSWAKGVYCQTNPKRQALADAVAAFGGKARIDQLRVVTRVLGIKDTDLHPLTLPRVKPNTLIWEPSVSRVGIWSATTMADESYAESRWCSNCDASATAVVRVPEVPGSILCRECCTSPFDPSRVFPSVYVDLALPETEIPADALIKAKSLPIGTVKKGRASWLEKVRSEIVEVPVVERLGSDLDGK